MALRSKLVNAIQYISDQGCGIYDFMQTTFSQIMKLRSKITKIRRDDNKLGHFMEHSAKLSCLKQEAELSLEVEIAAILCLISDCSWGRSTQYLLKSSELFICSQ